jgi:hypothetical protein
VEVASFETTKSMEGSALLPGPPPMQLPAPVPKPLHVPAPTPLLLPAPLPLTPTREESCGLIRPTRRTGTAGVTQDTVARSPRSRLVLW